MYSSIEQVQEYVRNVANIMRERGGRGKYKKGREENKKARQPIEAIDVLCWIRATYSIVGTQQQTRIWGFMNIVLDFSFMNKMTMTFSLLFCK